MSSLLPLTVIFLLLLIPTAYAAYIGAPYVPTRRAALRAALEAIKLGRGDLVVDLGAGDGGVLVEAARRGARSLGFELSPFMWSVAWWRTRGLPLIMLRFGNFYRRSLPADTTVIFLFLMPHAMPRVRAYLARQKLPRVRAILSYAFPIPGLNPERIIREHRCALLYVYEVKTQNGLLLTA